MGHPGQIFLKVTPSDLQAKAQQITAEWPAVPPDPVEPSQVFPSGVGLTQISHTREELANVVKIGQEEAARLAACLNAAATAYEQVDAINKAAIQGQQASVESVTVNPDLPPLTTPISNPLPRSGGTEDAAFAVDWQVAIGQFNDGDQGASLHTFAEELNTFGEKLRDRGRSFDLGNVHWEGQAAEAAEAALRQHQSWLFKLAEQCDKFSEKARAFAQIHNTRKAEHPDQADIDEVAKYSPENGGLEAYFAKQQESDNARSGYLSDLGNTQHIFLDKPPSGAIAPAPVKRGDVPDLPKKSDGGGPGGNGSGGGGGAPGDGQSPTGMPSSEPSVSPASANSDAGKPQSGSPSGGGGSPSGGGGSPSGGGGSPAGGGLPGGLGGAPELPPLDDPSLSPASAGGGGGGGAGSGGGGGGGGIPSAPLGPAVGAETVASSPTGARGQAAAGPAGPGGTGGMMGGMGGMGHGGQGAAQGKEKRRDPNLAPDEDLYVEDRAHSEPVIGHRPARRRSAEGNDDK